VCGLYFEQRTGTHFQFVPYRGGAPAMQDIIAGQMDLMCAEASQTLAYVRGGQMKAFAVMAKDRWPPLPDVPTTDEIGAPGMYISFWHGLWAPKGTPAGVIARLNSAVVDALADEAVRKRLGDLGVVIATRDQQTPTALATFHKAEIAKWWPIIKGADIKANCPLRLRDGLGARSVPTESERASRFVVSRELPGRFPRFRFDIFLRHVRCLWRCFRVDKAFLKYLYLCTHVRLARADNQRQILALGQRNGSPNHVHGRSQRRDLYRRRRSRSAKCAVGGVRPRRLCGDVLRGRSRAGGGGAPRSAAVHHPRRAHPRQIRVGYHQPTQ